MLSVVPIAGRMKRQSGDPERVAAVALELLCLAGAATSVYNYCLHRDLTFWIEKYSKIMILQIQALSGPVVKNS